MPTELEELVGFIADPKPEIRLLATQHLVPYSTSQPQIFKVDNLQPIKNLKVLLKDHAEIAEHAITILINLSGDHDVLENLVTDDQFLSEVLSRLTNQSEYNANLLSMLLANLSKSELLKTIVSRKRSPPEALGSSDLVINQLVDLFVKGADGSYNADANYDHLAYVFADLTKYAEIRQYFVTEQDYDGVIPLSKLKVFTEHKSEVRRRGVASTIKNVAFDISSHPSYLAEDGINMMPYILLPITGNEEYDEDDSMAMLPDLQLLPPDKERDSDPSIIQTHVETLTLLTTTREGREYLREIKVYPIIRETHLRVTDEGVQEACERIVQILMRDEAEATGDARVQDVGQEDTGEDNEIVEV